MRYGGFWQDSMHIIRLAAFGVALLVVVLLGLGIRHLRHSSPQPQGLNAIFAAVQKDVEQNFEKYQAVVNKWPALPVDTMPQHVAGYQFTLASAGQPGVVVSSHVYKHDNGDVSKITEHLQNVLMKAGFAKSLPSIVQPVEPGATQTQYRQADNVCTVTAYPQYAQVFLQCTSPTDLQQRAAEARPFVSSYLEQHPDLRPQDLIFGQLTIKSRNGGGVIGRSHAAGYDLAEAIIYRPGAPKGSLALFYGHTGQWKYIVESNLDERAFSCTTIEASPDASKAYVGQPCYDSALQRVRSSGVVQ